MSAEESAGARTAHCLLSNFMLTWEQLPEKLTPNMRVDIEPDVAIAEYRRLYPRYSPSDVFFAATTAGRSWRVRSLKLRNGRSQGLRLTPTS